MRGNVFVGGEVGFDRGAQRELNVVETNTMLPATDYTLEQLIEMAGELGADLSRVPGIR